MSRLPIEHVIEFEDLNERIQHEKQQKLFRERIRSTLHTREMRIEQAMRDALEFVESSEIGRIRERKSAIGEVFTEYEIKAKFHEIMESEVPKFGMVVQQRFGIDLEFLRN